jgi:transposase-like protein
MKKPKTLQQAIVHFADPDNCLNWMVALRWRNGVECPTCGRTDARFLANQRKWQCKSVHSHRQFSVKVGTIFEDSPISLDKWLVAVWMIANCKNGVSSYEIARAIGVTQKSAWFMLHRIRLAMQRRSIMKLGGPGSEVEVDETFIGGKARFMHAGTARRRKLDAAGVGGKTAVVGLLERGGEVRAAVAPNRRKHHLQGEVLANVKHGSAVYTDDLMSYQGLKYRGFEHQVVDHAERYVHGKVHTNGLENFWSLLKRGLKGTYISTEPFHLFRYLDEQVFRYNNRGSKENPIGDGERFEMVLSHVLGKRLTYAELTGKVGATCSLPN